MLKMNSLISLTPKHFGCNVPRAFTVMLDAADRIGYASSSIEDALGLDYSAMCGKHISMLLPELLSHCDDLVSPRTRIAQLEKMGVIKTLACHADGRNIPVMVMLSSKRLDAVLKPILLITTHPHPPSSSRSF